LASVSCFHKVPNKLSSARKNEIRLAISHLISGEYCVIFLNGSTIA
jgi:hypothetical protein